MQSVAGSRIMWLGILVSALVTGIPAQFGGVATAGTIGTVGLGHPYESGIRLDFLQRHWLQHVRGDHWQMHAGAEPIRSAPLSPELPRQSSTRPSRWQPPLAAAWISGRTTRQAFGSMTE